MIRVSAHLPHGSEQLVRRLPLWNLELYAHEVLEFAVRDDARFVLVHEHEKFPPRAARGILLVRDQPTVEQLAKLEHFGVACGDDALQRELLLLLLGLVRQRRI
jgi:hypothetical protein